MVKDDIEQRFLKVDKLKKYFPQNQGFFKRNKDVIRAVDDVSFFVNSGEVFGIVGESGSGKTTIARLIIRAIEPTSGKISLKSNNNMVDMTKLNKKELKKVRRDIQMIFQDPYSSLNPRKPVFNIVAEPLKAHGFNLSQRREKVEELLKLVGLNASHMPRYPHAFSGGQRQRIGIARALALNPACIVADEPVSALDVSIQAQILNLLTDLQEEMELTYLFIAHDLSVIRYICNRVAVMYLGKIVELATQKKLFSNPLHPYTSILLSAVPDADPEQSWLSGIDILKDKTSVLNETKGCNFAPRCNYASSICYEEQPELVVTDDQDNRFVACHYSDKLSLKGVI